MVKVSVSIMSVCRAFPFSCSPTHRAAFRNSWASRNLKMILFLSGVCRTATNPMAHFSLLRTESTSHYKCHINYALGVFILRWLVIICTALSESFIHSCTAVLAAESFVSLFCCEKKGNGSFKSPFWMKLAAHSIAEGYFKMDLQSLLALNFATEFAIKFFQLCSSASVWACVWTRICTCASTMFAFSHRW